MNPVTPLQTSRLVFIDRLRGLAVLVMIETHVVNALLITSHRDNPSFSVLNFINGLVAPTFLFCAGLSLAITLSKKWQNFINMERPFWRYVLRLLFILSVGYSLHLPFFSFTRMLNETTEQGWSSFFQSDVLHVISVTMLLTTFFALLIRNRKQFLAIAAFITFSVIFAAPIVLDMGLLSLPVWLRSYASSRVTTTFPLFPWSAFLILGMMSGFWFLDARESHNEHPVMKKLSLYAIVGIVIALLFEILPFTVYPHHDFWDSSPEFFFVRIGIVMLLLTGLWWLEQVRSPQKQPSRSFIIIFGQESLLVYVAHLLIVYGQDYDWSLTRYFGTSLNLPMCIGITIGLSAAMYVLAFGWHTLKQWNTKTATIVQYVFISGVIFKFLSN